MKTYKGLIAITGLLTSLLLLGCGSNEGSAEDGRTIVSLWTSWTGFEKDAIDKIVGDYNASQEKVFIKTLNISDPTTKILLATASGHPPDLAMVRYFDIAAYAENNSLTPLNKLCEEHGVKREKFIDFVWDTCSYRGFLWGMPLTASVTALHYNTKIFQEVGLDHPPRSMEELESFNDLITRQRPDGSIERIGHLPTEPGWWINSWSEWFGSPSWDNVSRITLDNQAWQDTADWLASYPERFGADNLVRFQSGFGKFASPQNSFFSGKVAMVVQGIWMDNFAKNYADENFEYDIAPIPTAAGVERPFLSIVGPDILSIPKGAKNVDEAFDFLVYMTQQEIVEELALLHKKITSLKAVSPEFLARHTNQHVEKFLEIANSPHLTTRAKMANYNKHSTQIGNIMRSLVNGYRTPENAFTRLQETEQKELDRILRRWTRVKEDRLAEWSQ